MKNLKVNKHIIDIIMSILGTIGIIKAYELTTMPNLSNNIINIFIFILLLNMYKKNTKKQKNEYIFSYCFSILLSTIIIIGTQLDLYGEIIWTISTILKILCLCFSIIPIILYSIKLIEKNKIEKTIKCTKKTKIATFFTIFTFDFLVFLALYPGIYGYDAGFQILEFLDKKVQLTSHFSLLFSFILANCVNLGKLIFNSYQAGLAIYIILQMICMTYVTTKISIYVAQKTKSKLLFILSIFFYSIFPLYTTMIISTAQDVIFSGIFALIILNIIDLADNKKYFEKKSNPIKLIILILLLCILRNNGFYAILATLPFIILLKKDKKITTIAIFIIPLILYKMYTGPIYNIMKVYKEPSIKEISSIPSQQLARVYNYKNSVLDEKDLKLYKKYYTNLDDFKYYTYRQSISDPIKSVLNTTQTSENLNEYLYFWIKIGTKDVENYIEAFLMNNLGTWYPNKTYNDDRMYHPYIEYNMLEAKKWNKKYIEIERNSKFPLYEKILKLTIEKNAWKKIPIISSLFTSGTYFIIYIYTIGLCIIKNKKKYLIPLGCITGLYATIFLAPVSLFRYVFPVFILLPIMISMIIEKEK